MKTQNYHYIRYAALFAFVAVLSQLPGWIGAGIPSTTIRAFGALLAAVAIVIDWRNYQLWKKENDRTGIGPTTVAIAVLYFAVLGWFLFSPTLDHARRAEIDDIRAAQRSVSQQLEHLVASNTSYGGKLATLSEQLNVITRGQHLQEKLEELDRMHRQNLITASEYTSKKTEILARF